jgi:hypothetical protein
MHHPIAPFVTAPVQPFVSVGVFPPTQATGIVVNPRTGPRTQIIAPAVPGVIIVQPAPRPHFSPRSEATPALPAPLVGTARADVIAQLGRPNASVMTKDGETLLYAGGLTVFMQNGQVASTK